MSIALVDRLTESGRALVRALDSHDVDAIEAMSAAFNDATIAVRNAGGWHATPDLKARVAEAMAQTEAARLRCAYYGDAARRRLEGLAGLGANVTPAIAYGRQGKI